MITALLDACKDAKAIAGAPAAFTDSDPALN
jgi:hypothetical protein